MSQGGGTMIKLLALGVLLCSSATLADITEIKITSFRQMGRWPENRGAELCGYVKFTNEKAVQVTVTVDPASSPGQYNTLVDLKGNFCVAISTYDGRAEARARSLLSESVVEVTTSATLEMKKP